MQPPPPPGKYRDQNVILISSSVFYWAGVIGNVADMSSELISAFWTVLRVCFTSALRTLPCPHGEKSDLTVSVLFSMTLDNDFI